MLSVCGRKNRPVIGYDTKGVDPGRGGRGRRSPAPNKKYRGEKCEWVYVSLPPDKIPRSTHPANKKWIDATVTTRHKRHMGPTYKTLTYIMYTLKSLSLASLDYNMSPKGLKKKTDIIIVNRRNVFNNNSWKQSDWKRFVEQARFTLEVRHWRSDKPRTLRVTSDVAGFEGSGGVRRVRYQRLSGPHALLHTPFTKKFSPDFYVSHGPHCAARVGGGHRDGPPWPATPLRVTEIKMSNLWLSINQSIYLPCCLYRLFTKLSICRFRCGSSKLGNANAIHHSSKIDGAVNHRIPRWIHFAPPRGRLKSTHDEHYADSLDIHERRRWIAMNWRGHWGLLVRCLTLYIGVDHRQRVISSFAPAHIII